MIGYVKQGSGWRPVFSGEATGDTVHGMGLSARAADFGHMDGSVAFDNFKLSSGDVPVPRLVERFLLGRVLRLS